MTALTETKFERAVKPESIALGVFGAIAALAALAIALLTISRQLQLLMTMSRYSGHSVPLQPPQLLIG